MSQQFVKRPSNLIQIDSGPSSDNLIKEIRYTQYPIANPGHILNKSMTNNTFSGAPLGGNITAMSHGYDNPYAIGLFLPDIHPYSSTEDKQGNNVPADGTLINSVEYLQEGNSSSSNSGCNSGTLVFYSIMILLVIALTISIICYYSKTSVKPPSLPTLSSLSLI